MDDKKRTKLLALGLAGIVGIYSLRSTVDGIVMKPVRELETALRRATTESESLIKKEVALTAAQRDVQKWQDISLPDNIEDAQRLYREWIFELARQCGFSGSGFEVAPGGKSSQKDFSTISVDIREAETDLQGLTRFLYLFDQSHLLHRISAMKIDSQGAQGKPKVTVTLTAEGMNVAGSPFNADRKELLPRTVLAAAASESAVELIVRPSEEFPIVEPFEPFIVRVDRELLKVEGVSESGWKVTHGIHGTKPAAHEANAVVELFPVAWDRREKTLENYAAFMNASPFVVPSPPKTWNPRLAGVSDKSIKPGEEVKFAARAESIDPEKGEALFALEAAAEGMAIDPKSGEFVWKPAETLAPGKYTATVLLTQTENPDLKLNSVLTITVKQPNAPPELTVQESAIVVIRREFLLTASAKDDGGPESLKYSLGAGAPEGLAIDAATGQVKWTPAATFVPGKYDVEIKVTDAGDEPQSASGKISLDVQDDSASLTILSAVLAKDDVWFAWFRNKGTGKTEHLKAGDQLNVSEIRAELVTITNRAVTLRDADGLWKLSLGDGLRDRKLIEPAVKPDPVKYDEDPAAPTSAIASPPTNEAPVAPAEPIPIVPAPAEPVADPPVSPPPVAPSL